MSDKSPIEWTDATWNPTVGCSIVSPGCTNCYAMKVAQGLERRFNSPKYSGLTKIVNGNAVWTGEIRLDEDALLQPLKWKKPRHIFVNSMSDLFHEVLANWQIARVFGVMTCATQHTYQVLTKRAARMQALVRSEVFWEEVNTFSTEYAFDYSDSLNRRTDDYRATSDDLDPENPPPNVWLGVSCERQQEADERIPLLLQTPAAVRFISAEPLLGPIDFTRIDDGAAHREVPREEWGSLDDDDSPPALWWDGLTGKRTIMHGGAHGDWSRRDASLDWIIVGGESGPNARPMHPDWARSIRDQCEAAGVPFFFKQWGEYTPMELAAGDREEPWRRDSSGREVWAIDELRVPREQWPHITFARVGKKSAGRLLDGQEHNGMPGRSENI